MKEESLQQKLEKKGHAPHRSIIDIPYTRSNFTIELKELIRLAKMVDDYQELRSMAYLVESRLKEAGWI